jgi:hypothetical protein
VRRRQPLWTCGRYVQRRSDAGLVVKFDPRRYKGRRIWYRRHREFLSKFNLAHELQAKPLSIHSKMHSQNTNVNNYNPAAKMRVQRNAPEWRQHAGRCRAGFWDCEYGYWLLTFAAGLVTLAAGFFTVPCNRSASSIRAFFSILRSQCTRRSAQSRSGDARRHSEGAPLPAIDAARFKMARVEYSRLILHQKMSH